LDRSPVVAQLIDGGDRPASVGQTFDRELADVFALQSELGSGLRDHSKHAVAGDPPESALQPTLDTLAYQLYLARTRCVQRSRTTDGFRRAIPLAAAAWQRDSTFARAWQLLGDVYAVVPLIDRRPWRSHRPCRTAVDRALALDPNLGEAHALRAHMHMIYDYDGRGRRELKLALALSRAASER